MFRGPKLHNFLKGNNIFMSQCHRASMRAHTRTYIHENVSVTPSGMVSCHFDASGRLLLLQAFFLLTLLFCFPGGFVQENRQNCGLLWLRSANVLFLTCAARLKTEQMLGTQGHVPRTFRICPFCPPAFLHPLQPHMVFDTEKRAIQSCLKTHPEQNDQGLIDGERQTFFTHVSQDIQETKNKNKK